MGKLGYTSYQGRTTWLLPHFSVPKEVHSFEMEDGKTQLGVMEFAPAHDRVQRSFWTYATNGMSERRMPCKNEPHGDPKFRVELIGYASNQADWVIQLLHAMAMYPFQQKSGFVVGHTLPVDAPQPRLWDGYLLVNPLLEPEDFNPMAIDIGIADWIFFVQVFGLVGPELEFGIEEGGPALIDRIRSRCTTSEDKARISFLDIKRKPIL